MKIRNITSLCAVLASLTFVAIEAMQVPIGRQNQVQSDLNARTYANVPYFTISVSQPVRGHESLEAHIKDLHQAIKSHKYGMMPLSEWHLSVIIFTVPFPNGVVDPTYVQTAMDTLEAILRHGYSPSVKRSILDALTDVTFEFKELKSLGNHKFLTAIFDRKEGTKAFYRVYGDIIRSFFDVYPQSWMTYGYEMKAHVSIARKNKNQPSEPLSILSIPNKPVKDIKLRHAGRDYQRKLHINARWQDPQTNNLVELTSHPI